MWETGTANGLSYQAKVFDVGSCYGINDGRISKLMLWNTGAEGKTLVANYDRGWDLKPTTLQAKAALKQILAKYR